MPFRMGTSCATCQSYDTIRDDERGESCCARYSVMLEDRIPLADAVAYDSHALAAGRSTVMGDRSAGGSWPGCAVATAAFAALHALFVVLSLLQWAGSLP